MIVFLMLISNRFSERPRRTSYGGYGGGGPPRGRSNYRIVVEGLSEATSWQDLKDFFKQGWGNQFCFLFKVVQNFKGKVKVVWKKST